MILLFMFGSCISYQIIITSLIQYICIQFGADSDFVYSIKFRLIQSLPLAILVLLPLSLKRDMSAFRYVSLASIGALLYTAVVLVIELPSYYQQNKPSAEVEPAYFDLDIFTGCSMTFFAFQC
mmetsp:Transcript_5608/g.9657  ORF Transcript_5608/g.9657 Transcript_5608/m.9657 type:complete len:123 (-) Transcript_5608:695-1063(-)